MRRIALAGNVIRVKNPRASTIVPLAPMPRQQRIVGRLGRVIAAVAEPRGWDVLGSVAVRVRPRVDHVPELVVCERVAPGAKAVRASTAALVVEVASSWSRGVGRSEQRWAYAAAGVKAYWCVELVGSRPPVLSCYRLSGGGYVRQTVVEQGNPQWVTLPIGPDVRLDVDELDH